MAETKNTLAIVHRSGFPLQMHVQEIIRSKSGEHHWSLFAHEHPWSNAEGGKGFVDLVAGCPGFWLGSFLGGRQCRATLIIECKRIAGTWVFLATPPAREGNAAQLLCFQEKGSPTPAYTLRAFGPSMPESEYCVLETGGKEDRRQLEGMGTDLLESVEAIARADWKAFADPKYPYGSALYVPVLVTTAALQLCVFEPTAASLRDGLVPSDRVKEQKVVNWVRFNKDLGFFEGAKRLEPAQWGTKGPHQTIFVVSAEHFETFLFAASGE
jgi:hypothetical protein